MLTQVPQVQLNICLITWACFFSIFVFSVVYFLCMRGYILFDFVSPSLCHRLVSDCYCLIIICFSLLMPSFLSVCDCLWASFVCIVLCVWVYVWSVAVYGHCVCCSHYVIPCSPSSSFTSLFVSVVEKEFRSLTLAKVPIPHCKNTLL